MFISTGNIGLSLRGRKTKYKFGAINLVYIMVSITEALSLAWVSWQNLILYHNFIKQSFDQRNHNYALFVEQEIKATDQ